MSIIPPYFRPLQQFYRSGPMPCPYIPGRIERKLFTRLSGAHAPEVNSSLSRAGFRRSHDIVYRPVCPGCNSCVPVRIPVEQFTGNRTQRRLRRRNADLTLTPVPAGATIEQYQVFTAYQVARHVESEMRRMSLADFAAMVDEGRVDSWLFEARSPDGKLRGGLLADRLDDGFSAVYSFYDPSEPQRSLGSWLILAMVEECRRLGLPYLYLGYWIRESRKMAYKAKFQPIEMLGREGWVPLPPAEAEPAKMMPIPPDLDDDGGYDGDGLY